MEETGPRRLVAYAKEISQIEDESVRERLYAAWVRDARLVDTQGPGVALRAVDGIVHSVYHSQYGRIAKGHRSGR